MGFSGWMLTNDQRSNVIEQYAPRFATVRASHVTWMLTQNKVIPQNADIVIIGHAANDRIEALLVSVNGQTLREDGQHYHITLSHIEGAASKESGAMIAQTKATPLAPQRLETLPFYSAGTQYRTSELG